MRNKMDAVKEYIDGGEKRMKIFYRGAIIIIILVAIWGITQVS